VSAGLGVLPVSLTSGATNYKNGLIFMAEGQGDDIPSAIYYLDPVPPYNTTGESRLITSIVAILNPVLLNNYFGRQFSSLNDAAINPKNKEIYFTDVIYGYLQDFRPTPGLPSQVYRFNEKTGAVTVVADMENKPNGPSDA